MSGWQYELQINGVLPACKEVDEIATYLRIAQVVNDDSDSRGEHVDEGNKVGKEGVEGRRELWVLFGLQDFVTGSEEEGGMTRSISMQFTFRER